MREPFLRLFSGNSSGDESPGDSWLNRVRENLAQLLIPAHFKPSSANGAPIHLLKLDKSLRPARAQGASLITHAVIFAAIVFMLAHPPGVRPTPAPTDGRVLDRLTISAVTIRTVTSDQPKDGGSRGGDHNPIPAKQGDLPPFSSLVLVRPTLPQSQDPHLPVPPTIFDPNSAPVLTPAQNVGLPWTSEDTNSAGPGNEHGIGSKDGPGLGDDGDGPAGFGGTRGKYGPGATQPACAYCPYPTYTDEARHGKVQGSVTLQVLVGADGRARNIRIVKGIGFGLDERAMGTVQGWRFIPARDGLKHAVAAWVTVEAVFRLF